MAPSLRAVSLAVAALTPLAAESAYTCPQNYNAKAAGAKCDGLTESTCTDSTCCDAVTVTTCAAFTCPATTHVVKSSPPTDCPSSGCLAGCCDPKPDTCIKMAASGETCDDANHMFADPAKLSATATDGGTYDANCCTQAATCQQFQDYFSSTVTIGADNVYDASKATTASAFAAFDSTCTKAKATCTNDVCSAAHLGPKSPLPTTACTTNGGLECSASECCDVQTDICLKAVFAGQSSTCPTGKFFDEMAAWDSSASQTLVEQCCKDKFECSAAGNTDPQQGNNTTNQSNNTSAEIDAATPTALGFAHVLAMAAATTVGAFITG